MEHEALLRGLRFAIPMSAALWVALAMLAGGHRTVHLAARAVKGTTRRVERLV